MSQKLTKSERSWIMYDVGNSAFCLLCTTIIPIYFKNIASQAGISMSRSTAYISYAISAATIIIALLGPMLGTVADIKGHKKPLFTFFAMMGVLGCAALSIPCGWIAFLAIYVIARVGFSGSLIFYDSMLVDVTEDERVDDVSSKGYAWGYLGSCIPFVFSLVMILKCDVIGLSSTKAMLVAFLLNAIWWGTITLPLLFKYKQKHYVKKTEHYIKDSFKRLSGIFGELRNNKQVFLFLLAFFFYIDGVYTMIDMATSYGKDVGLGDTQMLLALLMTQVVAFPCSLLFGYCSRKFETTRLVSICIMAYFLIAVYALQLDTAVEFWAMAACVGVFQGAIQALSRSYYTKIIPKDKASEYFGIFDIFGKGASFMGTMLMGITTQVFGTSKAGVVAIAGMFLVGFVLFVMTNVEFEKSKAI